MITTTGAEPGATTAAVDTADTRTWAERLADPGPTVPEPPNFSDLYAKIDAWEEQDRRYAAGQDALLDHWMALARRDTFGPLDRWLARLPMAAAA